MTAAVPAPPAATRIGRRKVGPHSPRAPRRLPGRECLERRVHAQEIAAGTEARDLSASDGGDHRVTAKLLTAVDVGEVDFDNGKGDGGDGVTQRERVVGEGAWIHDDGAKAFPRRALDPVDELAFVIRLPTHRFRAPAARMTLDLTVELSQRGTSVHRGLARPQEIEIGSVEDEDARGGRPCHCRGEYTLIATCRPRTAPLPAGSPRWRRAPVSPAGARRCGNRAPRAARPRDGRR